MEKKTTKQSVRNRVTGRRRWSDCFSRSKLGDHFFYVKNNRTKKGFNPLSTVHQILREDDVPTKSFIVGGPGYAGPQPFYLVSSFLDGGYFQIEDSGWHMGGFWLFGFEAFRFMVVCQGSGNGTSN